MSYPLIFRIFYSVTFRGFEPSPLTSDSLYLDRSIQFELLISELNEDRPRTDWRDLDVLNVTHNISGSFQHFVSGLESSLKFCKLTTVEL